MAENSKLAGFTNGVLTNAFWEGIKAVFPGALVTGTITAIWQKVRHGSLDWLGIVGMVLLTGLVLFFNRKKSAR